MTIMVAYFREPDWFLSYKSCQNINDNRIATPWFIENIGSWFHSYTEARNEKSMKILSVLLTFICDEVLFILQVLIVDRYHEIILKFT